ncbi:MAG: hypothetical protein KA524_03155 [Nitrosomonas sp.]|nr:hypothetical protein [Nitrosomonas sp.]MBP6076177.1 hypothetical protein [Nitrosomonas sp.]
MIQTDMGVKDTLPRPLLSLQAAAEMADDCESNRIGKLLGRMIMCKVAGR